MALNKCHVIALYVHFIVDYMCFIYIIRMSS